MSDKKEDKPLVEKHRIRARNSFEVINQIVNEYNSSNGWQVTKVIPSPLNLDVYLERSSKQGSVEKVTTSTKPTAKEVSVEKPSAKEEVKVAETTKKPTTPRKVSSKTADGGVTTNSTNK